MQSRRRARSILAGVPVKNGTTTIAPTTTTTATTGVTATTAAALLQRFLQTLTVLAHDCEQRIDPDSARDEQHVARLCANPVPSPELTRRVHMRHRVRGHPQPAFQFRLGLSCRALRGSTAFKGEPKRAARAHLDLRAGLGLFEAPCSGWPLGFFDSQLQGRGACTCRVSV